MEQFDVSLAALVYRIMASAPVPTPEVKVISALL